MTAFEIAKTGVPSSLRVRWWAACGIEAGEIGTNAAATRAGARACAI